MCLIQIPSLIHASAVHWWIWGGSGPDQRRRIMAFRSKGQQWRKRNGNDDARYQIPDHTKDQQSNKEEEKATVLFKENFFCLRSKATWLQNCTEMQWNISWWQKGKRSCSALALALAILWIVGTLSKAPPRVHFSFVISSCGSLSCDAHCTVTQFKAGIQSHTERARQGQNSALSKFPSVEIKMAIS